MPDLNLIDDEGGLEESPAPAPAAAPKKKPSSGGGGGSKTILIVLILVVVAAVAVFYLNKRGIIHLWGKKPAPVAEMQDEMLDQDMTAEGQEAVPGGDQQIVPADTQQVALLETPPVDEYTPVSPTGEVAQPAATETKPEPANAIKPDPIKPDPKRPGTSPAATNHIGEMKGEFTAQVGAFRDQTKADEIVGLLADGGYPAFVQRVPMKGADWYTVCIGKYGTRAEVKQAVENSAEQIRSQYVIARVR